MRDHCLCSYLERSVPSVSSGTLGDRCDKFPCYSASGNHHIQEEHQFPTYLVSLNIFWCISGREIKRILRTKLEQLLKPELLRSPRSLHLGHVVWSTASDYDTYSGEHPGDALHADGEVEKG